MWRGRIVAVGGMLIASFAAPGSAMAQEALDAVPLVAEGYPDPVQASLEARERDLAAAAPNVTVVPDYVIRPHLNIWDPGGIVRVAFQGGDAALRAMIEDAANEWSKPGIANIKLQFKDASGNYLQWTAGDTRFAGEIRIAFVKKGGLWSHIGRDSTDSSLNGGHPNEASFNLDNFDKQLPANWRAAVIHEFGHSLGFQHEHQNPLGGCDFRFEDDPGYVPTQNANKVYINDGHMPPRRPGLYTYLGGEPNKWSKARVDSNLKALQVSSAFLVGTFDKDSIMKYFFQASFFVKGEKSPCYTKEEGHKLSARDIEGARAAYPSDPAAVIASLKQQQQVLEQLSSSSDVSSSLRSRLNDQLEAVRIRLQQ